MYYIQSGKLTADLNHRKEKPEGSEIIYVMY